MKGFSRPRRGYELVFILIGVHHRQNIIHALPVDMNTSQNKHQLINPAMSAAIALFIPK
jgi:hypothetical protein